MWEQREGLKFGIKCPGDTSGKRKERLDGDRLMCEINVETYILCPARSFQFRSILALTAAGHFHPFNMLGIREGRSMWTVLCFWLLTTSAQCCFRFVFRTEVEVPAAKFAD